MKATHFIATAEECKCVTLPTGEKLSDPHGCKCILYRSSSDTAIH